MKKILLDIDASEKTHPAIEAAVRLARRSRAELEIVDVLPEFRWESRRSVRGGIERDLVASREEHLAAITAGAAASGVSAHWSLLRGKPAQAITETVLAGAHDLLVRSHARSSGAERAARFGPVDLELLKVCPCPVLLVSAHAPHVPLRVLLAVDANPDEQKLNEHILAVALALIEPESAQLTVLQAWDALGEQVLRGRVRREDVDAYVEHTREAAAAGLDAFLAAAGPALAGAQRELVRGRAQDAIQESIERHDIDLVVMGSVGRSGLQGLLMGNTAEAILSRVTCSVLVVKPEEFVSPIRAHES
jgi:nucleotide-binding universal stress UspA family protein